MVIASTFRYDLWSSMENKEDENITAHCLVPNGLYVSLENISSQLTLSDLKEELWEEVEKYPLFGHLKNKSHYIITAIKSPSARKEEIADEDQRICDVQPFFGLFKIAEKKELSEDNKLNESITNLIGKTYSEFNKTLKNAEVNDFRYQINLLGEEISSKRSKMSLKEKISYQYPPKLANSDVIPNTVRSFLLPNNEFHLKALLSNDDFTGSTLQVSCSMTPSEFIEFIMQKTSLKMKNFHRNASNYILKICGQEEYIFGDNPLIQFLYIQDELSRGEVPIVVVKYISDVYVFTSSYVPTSEIQTKKEVNKPTTLRKKGKVKSSWDITDCFQVTIQSIDNLNVFAKTMEIGMQVGIFQGGKSLCGKQTTSRVMVKDTSHIEWSEKENFGRTLKFDIKVQNLPRMARLCLVLYEISKNQKQTRARRIKDSDGGEISINPIAWVNTPIYDYKHQLKTGGVTLRTWSYTEDTDTEELIHPLGTVEPNPRTNECASITLNFHNYNYDCAIIHPTEKDMIDHADRTWAQIPTIIYNDKQPISDIFQPYAHNDRLNEISIQEKDEIWERRFECMRSLPGFLPSFLCCVEWNNRDKVAEVTRILSKWPKDKISVERTLELLDYAYADPNVRRFAVKCLEQIKDEDLQLYLLQLVQAIKHESYLYCDLVKFLLLRALSNQRIGHFLFWHLRSEIQMPSVQVRFSLILEAYLRSSREHISILTRQLNCLEKMRTGSEQVKKVGKEKAKAKLMEFLNSAKADLRNITSPINPSFRCKEVRNEKCKVMDSKMRPIWTVYANVDEHGKDINIIFKNGDDLRQDMLTLQMLRIMDRIWKSNGFDFRMNTYSCISMEQRLGMIEVVLDAETIANIQKMKVPFTAASAFKKGSLFQWLKEHNPTEEKLNKACQEFTLSCAGYSVATYVLGVADRHSDNIMVKKNGQLFHIDFGHILGHFKEKFGIRRERVPFVLTHDFVYVINKGRSDKDAEEFKKFQQLCEHAFITLRKHGGLILSLFSMMISTGLPELSSEKDLQYLKETLVLDYPEEKALEHFKNKFNEALQNSWKTSLNWASHNFSKNNNK